MSKLLRIKDLVQGMVDQGVSSVEEIHKAIAKLPFETLEKIDILEGPAQSAQKVSDQTIGGVYSVIRKVNQEVGKIAEELLDQADLLKDDKENY